MRAHKYLNLVFVFIARHGRMCGHTVHSITLEALEACTACTARYSSPHTGSVRGYGPVGTTRNFLPCLLMSVQLFD